MTVLNIIEAGFKVSLHTTPKPAMVKRNKK